MKIYFDRRHRKLNASGRIHRKRNGEFRRKGDFRPFWLMIGSAILFGIIVYFPKPTQADWISPVSDAILIDHPVVVEKPVEVPVKVPSVDNNILHIVDYIWLKESSQGKNNNPYALHNYCKDKGESNEFGYGGMALKKCFKNHEEARAWVTYWIARHLEEYDGNVSMTLCMYNLGQKLNSCPYSEGYVQ